jgi:hypothetical protein
MSAAIAALAIPTELWVGGFGDVFARSPDGAVEGYGEGVEVEAA